MRPDNNAKAGIWSYAIGTILVVWLSLLIAPSISGGIASIIEYFPAAISNPFQIIWCEDSMKTVLLPFMALVWGFICLPGGTTAEAKNTDLQNGEIRKK